LSDSPTEFPNVLVEGAFMSNPEDEILLMDENFRQKIAEAVYKGLVKFLKECKKDK
jgi:N-acetylmuramoyl-L-alanine amidase